MTNLLSVLRSPWLRALGIICSIFSSLFLTACNQASNIDRTPVGPIPRLLSARDVTGNVSTAFDVFNPGGINGYRYGPSLIYLRRSLRFVTTKPRRTMAKKIRAGILATTGTIGQRFVELLANHPQFEITALAASSDPPTHNSFRRAADGSILNAELALARGFLQ
jgi:Semialdehyde dehydrogenase, NAD binding domain